MKPAKDESGWVAVWRHRLTYICASASLLLLATVSQVHAEKSLSVAVSNLPTSLGNPFRTTAFPAVVTFAAIFDGLTWIDNEGAVQPALAVDWEVINETTWRFRLRDGVTFSNGERFDASAVARTIEYLMSEDGRATLVGREVALIDGATVIDPLTIELTTQEPFPTMTRALAAVRIPAPEQWRTLGPEGFATDPIGTGPFMVEDWDTGGIMFAAFTNSWRAPKVETLNLVVVPEQQARAQALQSGAVDIALSIGPEDRSWVEAAGGQLRTSLSAGNLVVSLRTSLDGPVSNSAVRKALNYAVNKELLVDVLMDGESIVASQPVVQQTNGFNPTLEPYPYDPDKARQLLTEAGYPDGFDMTIEIALGTGGNIDTMIEQMAADLRKIGVNVTLKTISLQQLSRRVYDGRWEGDAFTITMNTAPTLDALGPFRLHSCEWVQPWHCREEDIPLIQAARSEFDPQRRQDLLHELLRRYHNDPPAIYLVQLVGFTGLSPAVRDYNSDFGVVRFHDIDIVD